MLLAETIFRGTSEENDVSDDVTDGKTPNLTNGNGEHIKAGEEPITAVDTAGTCAVRRRYSLPKAYDEDEDNDWTNQAHDLLKAEVGDQIYEEMLKDQFGDALEAHDSAGFMSGLSVMLKKSKLGQLFNKTAIVCEGKASQCFPVGGAGFLTVVSRPKFPDHDFFRPGRCFRMRMRHENLMNYDDASLDGRVTCLKFSDEYEGGPLDLILQTGRIPAYYNATSFEEYLASFKDGERSMRAWALSKPINYYGRVESLRRSPASFYGLRYHSPQLYEFTGRDGRRCLARLRLGPADCQPETGLPSTVDQQFIWHTERAPDEVRAENYLHTEFMDRIRYGAIQYRLQMQLKDWPQDAPAHLMNPCLEWDSAQHPWLDVAMATITFPMTVEELSKTRLNLTNHQPCFKIPSGPSVQCFGSLGLVMSEFHGVLETFQSNHEDEITCPYVINVITGKVGNAGTDADVYITIAGTMGRTAPILLNHTFHDDFEAGQRDEFQVVAPPVGALVAVEMELRSVLPGREWFLDYVTVEQTVPQSKTAEFPCYRWLTSAQPKAYVRLAEALLSHEEKTTYGYLQRKHELDERRAAYRWEKVPGLPSRLLADTFEDIPREARFHKEKESDLTNKFLRTLTNTGYGTIKTLLESWESLEDYKKYLTHVLKDKDTVKKVIECWREDREFGRQFLNGVHPIRIRHVARLPPNFRVTWDMVRDILDRGVSFEQELKDGHIYLVSYPELEQFGNMDQSARKTKRFLACPMCLFYLNNSNQLLPVAIQLHQNPGPSNPIWLPGDAELDWLFAKMWVKEADAQIHQIISRHFYTHLVMEVLAVATMRNLPRVHPVFKLLVPHLRYTIAVNALGRQSLYPAEDGLFEKYVAVGVHYPDLLKSAYQKFKLDDLNLPKNLQARGVGDDRKLPGYYFRDDGLALWRIIKKFARTMLILHYWTPDNVQRDEEIQDWIQDIHENGFPMYDDIDHGIPSHFRSLDEVIEFITLLIFTASCQNAALTSGMVDNYAFLPNMPTMLLSTPPTNKGQVSMDDIMKALPGRTKTAEIIGACYTLSRFSSDELYLGEYPDEHFSGDVACAAILAFQEDLKNLSANIKERNQTLDWPYTYLLPEKIPNSIST